VGRTNEPGPHLLLTPEPWKPEYQYLTSPGNERTYTKEGGGLESRTVEFSSAMVSDPPTFLSGILTAEHCIAYSLQGHTQFILEPIGLHITSPL